MGMGCEVGGGVGAIVFDEVSYGKRKELEVLKLTLRRHKSSGV